MIWHIGTCPLFKLSTYHTRIAWKLAVFGSCRSLQDCFQALPNSAESLTAKTLAPSGCGFVDCRRQTVLFRVRPPHVGRLRGVTSDLVTDRGVPGHVHAGRKEVGFQIHSRALETMHWRSCNSGSLRPVGPAWKTSSCQTYKL